MNDSYSFGFAKVAREQRKAQIEAVFAKVAPHYDRMNNIMSLGLHHLWKRQLVWVAAARENEKWLDLATGSGDISALLATDTRGSKVVAADPSPAMLDLARKRLKDRAEVGFVCAPAESLPFADGSFAGVICAFGLRNFTDRQAGLTEIHRILKPGGRLLILEFSQPAPWLRTVHRRYLLDVLPALGAKIANDEPSYRYLAESILSFPTQKNLAATLGAIGFAQVDWFNLAAGIAAIHRGWKLL